MYIFLKMVCLHQQPDQLFFQGMIIVWLLRPEENMGTWLDDDFYWEEWIIVV